MLLEKCTCGHEHHRHQSGLFERWLLSLCIVVALLFLIKPFMVQQMLLRVASYFSCASYDEAVRICKKIIFIDSNNTKAWSSLGYAYREKGDFDKALAAYQKAYSFKPDDRGANFDLGMVYFSQKEFSKAIPYFEYIRNKGKEGSNSLDVSLFDYHYNALTMLEECFRALGADAKSRQVKQEIKKYYPSQSAGGRINLYGK